MREYGIPFNEVLKMGYFEVYRLWFILDELKARDLQHMSLIMDAVHATDDYRKNVIGWLEERQPRSKSPTRVVPSEVLEKFAEAFKRG